MESFVASWVVPSSTVILVLVTGWYAYLTRRLAKSAESSAVSAERAAQIAASALAATIASVDVRFGVAPGGMTPAGTKKNVLCVSIRCEAATVFIHAAHLDFAYRIDRSQPGISFIVVAEDVGLSTDGPLPMRLHSGESALFITEPEVLTEHWDPDVSRLEVLVWYSLDGMSDPVRRRVSFEDLGGRQVTYAPEPKQKSGDGAAPPDPEPGVVADTN